MTVKNIHGLQAIDSREVAEMVGKQHKHLLRDIAGYIKIMKEANESKFGPVSNELKIEPSEFFIPSTYLDSKGETRPCYLITKKGCDMIANKLTGEKGVLFTAAYVTAFEEMQKMLSLPYQNPAFFPPKSTSAGEVASLLRELRQTMKENKRPSETVSRQVETTCQQFGVVTVKDFVGTPPFEQMAFYLPEPPTQSQMPQ